MITLFFFFNDTATTEIYTLSLHDRSSDLAEGAVGDDPRVVVDAAVALGLADDGDDTVGLHDALVDELGQDRKSTRLNSSHANISYAVFCLKKKISPKHPH